MSVADGQAVTIEHRRDWAEIGLGLTAAFALVGIGSAGVWAVVVLAGALT